MTENIKIPRGALLDPSLWAVIAGNILSIYLAVTQHWPLGEIMWVYWVQSIIIGATNVIRMASLKKFSTKDVRMNGKPVPETPEGKWSFVAFFIAHYGIFHFVYAGFLWGSIVPTEIPLDRLNMMMIAMLGFIGAHIYSLRHNIEDDLSEPVPNIGTLMAFPYFRIIPMHFTIIFGGMIVGDTGFNMFGMLLFMALKTLADAGMHVAEHKVLRGEMRNSLSAKT